MPSVAPVVLVTGATGVQGGGVIRELLLKAKSSSPLTPFTIRAFVRDPSSAAAQALVALDRQTVQLFQGDFDDVESLRRAAEGATATFINVTVVFADLQAESRHGHNILSASLAAGVKHVIYSAVNRVDKRTDFKGFEPGSWVDIYYKSKGGIVDSVKSPPFPTPEGYAYTILLPALFLANYIPPLQSFMFPQLSDEQPSITTAQRPDLKSSTLDPDDIGRFAAHAILASEAEFADKWANQTIPLASVDLTLAETIDLMTKSVGGRKTVEIKYLSRDEALQQASTNPLLASQLFLNDNPNLLDLDKVRSYGIPLGGVEAFFERNKAKVEQALGL